MGGGREVPISLEGLRDKNLMQLKKLNTALFPVRYNDKYYADALLSGDFTKLGQFRLSFFTASYHYLLWALLLLTLIFDGFLLYWFIRLVIVFNPRSLSLMGFFYWVFLFFLFSWCSSC